MMKTVSHSSISNFLFFFASSEDLFSSFKVYKSKHNIVIQIHNKSKNNLRTYQAMGHQPPKTNLQKRNAVVQSKRTARTHLQIINIQNLSGITAPIKPLKRENTSPRRSRTRPGSISKNSYILGNIIVVFLVLD